MADALGSMNVTVTRGLVKIAVQVDEDSCIELFLKPADADTVATAIIKAVIHLEGIR